MRLSSKGFAATVAVLVFLAPMACRATSCTTQAALLQQERDALTAAGGRLAVAVAEQDMAALKAALLPAVTQDWEGISSEAQVGAVLMKGGQIQLRNLYLLDATSLSAPADTQFFCTSASGSVTVTLNMHALPPGRYAVVLADAAGAPYAGQLGFILAWDGPAVGWKLGGLTVRPGTLDGHDGVWWWSHARELARTNQDKIDGWSAWYAYETARMLLLPMDFLSSPNLEKLGTEQTSIQNSPQSAFPLTLPDGPRTWKIDAVRLDPTLLHADLGVDYESTGVTDPAALRTEAIVVLSALLKAQPGLRENFHGLWAYAVKDGKRTPVIELPMAQIP
ncbi:MAG: hypothetical protein ABSE55_12685 [Terracidiphilus sp.]|jgi:hypothetical protein